MGNRFRDWLDHRTGYRRFTSALLLEHIPGGARWRYVWGSCLAFVFLVQLVTGVLLMTAYSPGASTAWASVYYIQYEMDFGWFIRGLHHFGSQTMVVLMGLHMLQVVIAGAHLPPREVNWWLGLVLMGLVLALSLTGYLLPWDQKGFFATQVATNIAGNLPGIGQWLQKVIVGGPEYGNHTLTRFYALHVGILPPLVIVFIILHLVVFRRHGVTTPRNAQGEGWFWPDQAFRDMLICLAIFGVMIGLVVYGHGNKVEPPPGKETEAASVYDKVAHAGRDGKGAHLDAPADPAAENYPARPEWYFLFLFQLLKYFEGDLMIVGTVLIPNGVLLLLALLPLLGYGRMRPFGHVFGVVVVSGLLIGVGALTYLALAEDRGSSEKAQRFREDMEKADVLARRAVNLAHVEGIPAEGSINLLRRDPLTQGPKLFTAHCASCHTYKGLVKETAEKKATASDLAGFGTEEWIHGLLTNPGHKDYFGRVPHLDGMKEFVANNFPLLGLPPAEQAKLPREDRELLEQDRKDLRALARWLASHPRKTSPHREEPSFKEGLKLFKEKTCISCHTYEGKGGKSGPDLTGYGDADWLRVMIMAPYHRSRYGMKNTMPAFRDLLSPTAGLTQMEIEQSRELMLARMNPRKADEERALIEAAHKNVQHLSDVDRELIIRWLLGDYRLVFGGEPIAPPLKQ